MPFLWEIAAFVKSDGKPPFIFYQIMDAHIYNIYHTRVLENLGYYFINLIIYYQRKASHIYSTSVEILSAYSFTQKQC